MTRWSGLCAGSSIKGGALGGSSRGEADRRSGSVIRLYRIVFAWLPSSCRFEPTCSRYTEQAIEKYGLLEGELDGRQAHRPLPPLEPGRL